MLAAVPMRRRRTTSAPARRAQRALLLALVAAPALCTLAACTRHFTTGTVPAGRMGEARLYLPREPDGSLVLLFSDAPGWRGLLDDAAAKLATRGAIVVGVDLPTYLKNLAASDDGCHYLLSEVEELSHRIERDHGFARYRSPVLAGIGAGGTLAYAALAQSPAATVAGAVSVDPDAVLRTRVPLCPGAASTPATSGGFSYGPRDPLPGWWRVSVPAPAAGAQPALFAAPAVVETAAAGTSAGDRLVAAVSSALGARDDADAAAPDGLAVIPYPSESGSDTMAIIYSGDGGWRDLDKQIGETLAARGLPVVGVDSLRSFWTARTPAQMAQDLAALIQTYQGRWGTRRVVLIGYSFGAGVLPFAINLLPPEVRAEIVLVALLGVDPRADFEIRLAGWLGEQPDDKAPEVLPQLLQLDLSRLQCFYGEEEQDSLCRVPELAKAEIIRTSGGHHFDGDYGALAARILDGIARRAPGAVPAATATPVP